jgi:hypothetical protein
MTDLVEELMTYQRTMPSWKAWERETVGWKGMAEENIKMYIGVDSAEWNDHYLLVLLLRISHIARAQMAQNLAHHFFTPFH